MDNSKSLIETINTSFTYRSHHNNDTDVDAVKNFNVKIEQGEYIVMLGRNGSGKSTLARMLNALMLPTDGIVYVNNINTKDDKYIWEIRKTAGMVFQNPDNQIVGTTVEEDVAFGPENLGVPTQEIRNRVDDALTATGMVEYAKHAPHLLSGGQKQRVAIAGVLAMKPRCIILDEATSMLDPIGRNEVYKTLREINKNEGITVLLITHHMDEAALADRVLIIDNGKLIIDGTPKQVFKNADRIKSLGLDVPQITELFNELKKEGFSLRTDILTVDEALSYLLQLLESKK